MAYFIWALNNGKLHNSTLHQVSFGTEVTYTSGWQQLTVNSFSGQLGLKTGGGGGGGSYHGCRTLRPACMWMAWDCTGNGSDCGQWSSSGSANQNWNIMGNGHEYQKKTRRPASLFGWHGIALPTAPTCGQWSNSGSNAQKWSQQSYNGNYRFQNNQTGLYLDGIVLHRQWLRTVSVEQQRQYWPDNSVSNSTEFLRTSGAGSVTAPLNLSTDHSIQPCFQGQLRGKANGFIPTLRVEHSWVR